MGDLRLTHGGFYRHFRGKDELFGEALAEALQDVSLRLERAALSAPEHGRAQAIIDAYLSPEHLGDVAGGCPVAALASDLSRAGRSLHGTAFEAAAREHIGRMANYLPGDTLEARLRSARVLFSGMAGTMAMSRALADPRRQREMLAEARQFYRTALGV
jgi:TetR/AcrR family transcriptional repressor of nem operon